MSVLAAVRPGDWNLPLLVHVLGAMVLVGALFTALLLGTFAWRRTDAAAAAAGARFAFWTLLLVAFPAWWAMRIGAGWIYSRQGWSGDDDPAWIGIGFATAEGGGLLLLLAIVLVGLGARRLRHPDAGTSTLARVSTVLVAVALLAYVVAVWAMSAKPG